MELRNRHVGKPKEETDTATDTATSASSSCESTSEASSVDVCRRWPPMVTEAPSWPVGGDKTTSAGEGDVGRCADEQTDSSWRLFHWGPMIAIFIVAYISAVTTYFTLLWWPLSSVGGLVHYAIFLLWNGLTLANHMKASAWGAGYVPLKWRPPKKEHESQLQWCAVCEGFKAPRSHHCSKCKRCCMKMDHHCPWINNCVGHRNHSVFVRFLFFAIVGCIHAFIIHCICFYHAVNMHSVTPDSFKQMRRIVLGSPLVQSGWPVSAVFMLYFHDEIFAWYIRFGNGSDPLIHLSLWTLLSLVVASAFAVGVALGLTMLLVIQIKYLWKNQTGIEQYIDQKAVNRRQEEDDLDAWIYPYNLGWRRNLKEVICSWTGIPRGNGIWWPVVEDCNQFTITLEQLHQKELKRGFAKLVEITDEFAGGVFASCRLGLRVFFCQPLTDEARVRVSKGEEWVITRGQRHWFYGHKKGEEKCRGWFPRKVAEVTNRKPYDD